MKDNRAPLAARRESNMELLRIVSIFMIIVFHCAYKSGFDFSPGLSINTLILKCIWMLGELGTNLFMLISGYYMIHGQFKLKKLIRLLAEVQFYTWITIWLGGRLGIYALSDWKSVLFAFFPVTLNWNWFITAYILIYILSPYLNLLIRAMDVKIFRRFLGTVLGLYCLIPTVFGLFLGGTENMRYYNRMIWLAIMYFLGAYIRKYGKKPEENRKQYVVMAVCSGAVMTVSILAIDRFSGFFAALGTTEPAYFWPPNTLPMVFLSIGVFGMFRNVKISFHPWINRLASTTLGIYLLHDGILSVWLWEKVFRCAEYQDSPYLVFRILMAAAIIFTLAATVDLLRQTLERPVVHCILKYGSVACISLHAGRRRRMEKMKCIMAKAKNTVFRDRRLRIFCSAFLLYLFLGMCLSYYTAFDTNMFFGADNARVFQDLTNITGEHYRVSVHPLLIFLTETIILLIDGVVNRPMMSVILVEAFCGGLSVCLFDAILGQKKVDRKIRNLYAFLYAFSFSNMIFSTVPETFIFAALGLLLFWRFAAGAGEIQGDFSGKEIFLLIFFGVVCIGVTLTNYVFYIVGLLYVLSCRYNCKNAAKMFLKINSLNAVSVIIACLYQKFVWKQCPLFWTSILDALSGRAAYSEISYMNWSFGLEKMMQWVRETIFHPLLSAGMDLIDPGAEYHPILFVGYSLPIQILLLLFCGAMAASLGGWLIKRCVRFHWVKDGYVFCLLLCWGGNLILHSIYGADEAFMYSPHFLFYILLALAFAVNDIKNPAVKRMFIPALGIFCTIEAINNLNGFFRTARIALSTVNAYPDICKALKGSILCGILLLSGILFGSVLRSRERKRKDLSNRPENYADALYGAIKVYSTAVLIVSLFLAFNY